MDTDGNHYFQISVKVEEVEPLRKVSQAPMEKLVVAVATPDKMRKSEVPATNKKTKTTVQTKKRVKSEEYEWKPVVDETITSEVGNQEEVNNFNENEQDADDLRDVTDVDYVTKGAIKNGKTSTTTNKTVFTCEICSYKTHKKFFLTRHLNRHSDDRPYKCSVCEKGFKSQNYLKCHQNVHLGIKPYKCKDCEMAFKSLPELSRHVINCHTLIKPFQCTECDYSSVEKSKLQRHMRSHTGERPYQCPHCTYASTDTFKLKRHMRTHTGEKPYECDICHVRFAQLDTLKEHQRVHQEKPDKPKSCKRCKAVLPDDHSYKEHMKTHESEKRLRCELCSYTTTGRRHLEEHMFIHLDIKPYVCNICKASFRIKQRLDNHMKVSHTDNYTPPEPPKKDHKCSYCVKKFVLQRNLIRHMKSHNQTSEVLEGKQKLKIPQQDVQVEDEGMSEDKCDEESELNENTIQNGYNQLENEGYKEQINQNRDEKDLQDENMQDRNVIEVKEEKLETMDIPQPKHKQVISIKTDVDNNESNEIMSAVMNNDQDSVVMEVLPDEDNEVQEEDQEIQMQKVECGQPFSSPESALCQKTKPANLNKIANQTKVKKSNTNNTQPVIADYFGFEVDAKGRRKLRRYKT